MFSKILTAASMASMASGHLLMTNPVPFPGLTDNGPLLEDGSNFPCKAVSYEGGAGNTYEQGSTQTLEFKGTAVHGGGSCQVSVTKDLNPTADSVWKVIKSIEGGCPAKNTPGNLPGDSPETPVPFTYDFTIPQDLAAGEYVLAWTWFNKVGNREMYMNCAPVSVTGSGGSEGHFDGLPDMMVANIGNDCQTEEGLDYEFFNPGTDVDQFGTNLAAPELGFIGAGCARGGGGGGGGSPDPEPQPTTVPEPTEPAPSPVPSPTTPPGGIFIPVPSDEPVPEPVPEPQPEPAPEPAPEPEPVPTPPDNETPPPSGGNPPGTACFEEGTWNCVGGSSFQRCASGTWSAVQSLAAGINCEDGEGAELKVTARSGERSMRRSLRVRPRN